VNLNQFLSPGRLIGLPCLIFAALLFPNLLIGQCRVIGPKVPRKPDTLCTFDKVRTSYLITSSIKPDSSTESLEWSLDGKTYVKSNNGLLDSTKTGTFQIFVRQFLTATHTCNAVSTFTITFLPIPPNIPGLNPLPAPDPPDINRTVFVCEGYNLDLNNFVTPAPGYSLRFKADSNGVRVPFKGLFRQAKYTGRDTIFHVANFNPKSCEGNYLDVNVSVLPKPTLKNNPLKYQVCEKQPIFFNSLDVHVGVNPTYDWYLNGKEVVKGGPPTYEIFPNPFKAGDPVKVFYIIHISKTAPYYHCDSVGPPWHSDTISIKILPLAESKFHKGSIRGPDVVYYGQKAAFYQVPLDTSLTYTWKLSKYSQGKVTGPKPAGVLTGSNNTAKVDYTSSGLDFSSKIEIIDTVLINAKNICDSTGDTLLVHIRPYLRPINILTPNGDNINDTWIVDNIDYPPYTDNQVTIYNRYGNVVYSTSHYSNLTAWNGMTGGHPVSEGTYYYVLLYKEDDVQKSIKGYLTILRK